MPAGAAGGRCCDRHWSRPMLCQTIWSGREPSSVEHDQMPGLGLWHGITCQPLVEGDEAAAVPDCQGQQVGIGDLAVAQHVLPVQCARGGQAGIVRPEPVLRSCTGFGQPSCHLGRGKGAAGVGGLRQDADAAVLGDRAGSPAVSSCRQVLSGPVRGCQGLLVPQRHARIPGWSRACRPAAGAGRAAGRPCRHGTDESARGRNGRHQGQRTFLS